MDDWNSHPRYRLLWFVHLSCYKWPIASVRLRQSSRPRTDSVLCFILAYLNVQHLQCSKSTEERKKKIKCSITYPLQLCTTVQVSSCPLFFWSQTSRDRDQEMVAYLTKIPHHFNLRVEYIRPTALTRFTCCHLPPVGGELWGSEADRGKAPNRQVLTRDR